MAPKYYSSKTLLGGDPDTNKRFIHDQSHREVAVFNADMKPWTIQHAQELNKCLNALNQTDSSE